MTEGAVVTGAALALTAAVCGVFLKQSKAPTLALLAVLTGGILLLLRLLPSLGQILDAFASLGEEAGLRSSYFQLILRITGIACLCEFTAQLCRDAAQGALAFQMELLGKTAILLLSLPVLSNITETVWALLS